MRVYIICLSVLVLADGGDEDEGEAFEFEDSGDEVTGAELPPPAPEASGAPAPAPAPSDVAVAAGRVKGPAEPPPASAPEDTPPVTARTASIAKGALGEDGDLPLPPPPAEEVGRTGRCGGGTSSVPAGGGDRVARLLFPARCCGFRSSLRGSS